MHRNTKIHLNIIFILVVLVYFTLTIYSHIPEGNLPPDGRRAREISNIHHIAKKDVWQMDFNKLLERYKSFKFEKVPDTMYGMNMERCQNTPLRRHVPDSRPMQCRKQRYPFNLPKASIIIPFHNEAWPVILRTLHGIYDRTPSSLVEEIILIDDQSDRHNLLEPLAGYIDALPKTRLVRTSKREGLIRARLVGSRQAKGDALVFLDAHVEVGEHWLEPLLDVIGRDPTAVAIPNMENLDPDSMEYMTLIKPQYGSFSWGMAYIWIGIPRNLLQGATNVPTAGTIGCAIAVGKKFFKRIREFDDKFEVWGGENLEISFKSWLCGGSMLWVPCSSVAHMYKKATNYKKNYGVIRKNLQRLVETWLGDFRKYYYNTMGKIEPFTEADKSSIRERKRYMKSIGCKSFDYYLRTVAPVAPVDDNAIFYGQLQNIMFSDPTENTFKDSCAQYDARKRYIPLTDCNDNLLGQSFAFTKQKQLKHYDKCLTYKPDIPGKLTMLPCTGGKNQHWEFNPESPESVKKLIQKPLVFAPNGRYYQVLGKKKYMCLAATKRRGISALTVRGCHKNDQTQYFVMGSYYYPETWGRAKEMGVVL